MDTGAGPMTDPRHGVAEDGSRQASESGGPLAEAWRLAPSRPDDSEVWRLRASGLRPMVALDENTWSEAQGWRLASALVFPIDSYSLDRLIRWVVRENSTAVLSEGEAA